MRIYYLYGILPPSSLPFLSPFLFLLPSLPSLPPSSSLPFRLPPPSLSLQFIDTVGVIVHVDDDNDIVVNYHSNAMFHINSAAATKVCIYLCVCVCLSVCLCVRNCCLTFPPSLFQVDTTIFRVGDIVRVMEDRGEVSKLQKGHGEWNDSMSIVSEDLGRVHHGQLL